MAGRPPKSHLQLVNEKKSHRTKAEMETRKKGEEALRSGVRFKEWSEVKSDPVAHKEFTRLRRLLKKISYDDALYESVINRYCLLTAECKQLDAMRAQLQEDLQGLTDARQLGEVDFTTYLDRKESVIGQVLAIDKKVMEKRKMMLQIEKENIMTILAALRAVPKVPDKAEEKSKMADFLERRKSN